MRGDDALWIAFLKAKPKTSSPLELNPLPSGKVLGRHYERDSAGRTILGGTTTDEMSGGPGAPEDDLDETITFSNEGSPALVLVLVNSGWETV